ncbi:ATP-binding protein [Ruegeria sp.]|uniref:ATP-binding protein n=1 Tax=Ruegeria sp. TaxID=1879320 RepID=UPI003B00F189
MNVSLTPQHNELDAEPPGFTRMLLVDTNIFKGVIGEVPLDGNVLITGTNAAGKTSVIQALPLGFGLPPHKLSRKAQDKTFFGHYLPRTTSYVAFEYRNRAGSKRAVIMHLATTEEKLVYRFVRSELYENMFVTNDGKFVEFSDLAKHLRDQGYQIASRQITTQVEYQTIIQGLPIENPRRNDVVQLQADYALAPPRTPLRNVENVIFSMLKKDGSLRALEDMVAEQVLRGERRIKLGGKRESLASWPKRFRSYRDVMAKEDDVLRLVAKNTVLEEAHRRRKEALSEMRGLLNDLEEQLETLSRTLPRQELAFQEAENAHAVEREAARKALAEIEVKLNTASAEVKRLTEKHARFMDDNIEAKVAEFARLSELEDAARQVSERLTALKSELSELTSSYDTLKEARREAADNALREIALDRKRSEDGRRAKREAIETRRQESRRRAEEDYAPQMMAASDKLKAAAAAVGAGEEAAKNPTVDSEVLERVTEAQKEVDTHQAAYNAVVEQKAPLQAQETAAKSDVAKVDGEIERLSQSKLRLEKTREKLEASKAPSDGTLLAFLRRQRPDWGDTLGRVLREDLLSRTDLSPKDLGAEGSVFGLDLDLEDVAPLQQADLSVIELNIDRCMADIGEVQQNIATAKRKRDEVSSRLRGIRRKSSELEVNTGILARKLKHARGHLTNCHAANDTALEAAREAAITRLQEAKEAQARAEREKTNLEAERAKDLAGYDLQHREESEALEEEIMRTTQALFEWETRIRNSCDADLKELDEERAKALRDKGVDPRTLQDLEKSAKTHRDALARVRAMEKTVVAWRSFLADDWSRVDACRAEAENHKVTVGRLSQALEQLIEGWTRKRIGLKREIDQTEKDLSALRENRSKLEIRLQQNAEERLEPVSTSRTVDALLSALNDAERESNTLTQEIRNGVKDVARVFMAEPGSPPEQHIQLRRQAFQSFAEGPEWLPAFEDWFNELHEQHRDTLRNDAHFHAEEFKNKYQMLKRTDERITEENRLLQRSLSQNIATDVVEDIQIKIESGIKELEFLPALERISELHEDWTRSGEDLPPNVFTEALSDLLEYWSGNDGITADLRQQIRLRGHVVENGIKRDFHASTDLADISSNGVSYLILTTILVGFINIVRGKKPVQMVWALDELGNIDSRNVRNLLKMLNDNGINLISATPNADLGVRERFAQRLRIVKDKNLGPRLMEVRGAAKPSHSLVWSKETQKEQTLPSQSVSVGGEG